MFDKDHAAKVLFGNTEAVANLVNEAFCQGRECFRPEQFHALPTEAFCLKTEGKSNTQLARATMDAFWRYELGKEPHRSLFIGLEFQATVNYFMPGRLFLNAALNINAQHREIDMMRKAQWGKRGYSSTAEYLSRFRREDKVVKPLIIIVYFGDGTWDGPTSLNDISCPLPSELAEFDYDMKIPVVDLDKIPIEKVLGFEQNLKLVLLYAKGRKDPELLRRILAENPGFRRVPRIVAELIQTLFHAKLKIPKDKEIIDMCLAEELMIEEGRKEGRREGMEDGLKKGKNVGLLEGAVRYIQVCRNNHTSRAEILSNLKSVFLLSSQKATALLKKA